MKQNFLSLLLAVLLCSVLSFNVRAQTKSRAEADSLLRRVASAKTDSTKIRILSKLIDFYSRRNKYVLANHYTAQQIAINGKLKWPLGSAIIAYNQAKTAYAESAIKNALPVMKNVYEKAKQLGDKDFEYKVLSDLVSCMYDAGQKAEALKIEDDVLTYYEKKRNYFELAVEYNYLCTLAFEKGKAEDVLKYGLKAVEYAKTSGNYLVVAKANDNLARYYAYKTNFDKAFELLREALLYLKGYEDTPKFGQIWQTMGGLYQYKGKSDQAIDCYLNFAKNAEVNNNQENLISATYAIATIYANVNDNANAFKYMLRTATLTSQLKNHSAPYLHDALQNAIHFAFQLKDYDQALSLANRALELQINDTVRVSDMNSLSWGYFKKKDYDNALGKALEAQKLADKIKATNTNLTGTIGSILRDAPDDVLQKHGIPLNERYERALKYLIISRDANEKANKSDIVYDDYFELSALYEKTHQYELAFQNYKKYVIAKDSVTYAIQVEEVRRKIAGFEFSKKEDSLKYQQRLTTEKLSKQTLLASQQQQALLINNQKLSLAEQRQEVAHLGFLKTQADLQAEQNKRKVNEQALKVSQKERALIDKTFELQKTELRSKKNQTYYLMVGVVALILLSFFIARNYSIQRNANQLITAEKQRSDELLLNILPSDVAAELKEKGSANARLFDEVTVLFTDFVNFTNVSETLTPQELVDELNHCFKTFDQVMMKYGIEKIKTIGDAYLAVCGLPMPDSKHAVKTVNAALEILELTRQRKNLMGDKTFNIRIGIHTGSVVAGIVGIKKFAYDVWGDAVNTAARMEQTSEPGKINISHRTYEIVKNNFDCFYRGEINAKNKGTLKMYFIESAVQEVATTE